MDSLPSAFLMVFRGGPNLSGGLWCMLKSTQSSDPASQPQEMVSGKPARGISARSSHARSVGIWRSFCTWVLVKWGRWFSLWFPFKPT